jgi:hypothetical protein
MNILNKIYIIDKYKGKLSFTPEAFKLIKISDYNLNSPSDDTPAYVEEYMYFGDDDKFLNFKYKFKFYKNNIEHRLFKPAVYWFDSTKILTAFKCVCDKNYELYNIQYYIEGIKYNFCHIFIEHSKLYLHNTFNFIKSKFKYYINSVEHKNKYYSIVKNNLSLYGVIDDDNNIIIPCKYSYMIIKEFYKDQLDIDMIFFIVESNIIANYSLIDIFDEHILNSTLLLGGSNLEILNNNEFKQYIKKYKRKEKLNLFLID